jgi:hypothetical protein
MNGNRILPRTLLIITLLTGSTAMLAATVAGASCLTNFTKRGSIFTHWVYSTSADLADVSVGTAVERLRQQLPSKQIEVLTADATHGVLHGTTLPDSRQRTYDVDFVVSPLGSGARVKMAMTLPPTVEADPRLKESMCDTINLAAVAAASPAPEAAAGAGQPAPAPVPAQTAPPAAATQAEAPRTAAPHTKVPRAEPSRPETQEPALTNQDVIRLAQAGLASDLIVTKIMQASSVAFDLSTNALVELASLKIPHDVIAAMMQRAHDHPK